MKKLLIVVLVSLFIAIAAGAQEKVKLLVNPIKTGTDVAWPYDSKQLQTQVAAELMNKVGKKFAVVTEAPEEKGRHFVLDCEVVEWHAGNAAQRALIGMGAGRESAKVRYSLTDPSGKKVMEREDTIRAEFWGNAYAGSVGQLAHPLADKIAGRLGEVKVG
jgi:hypothetical protein